MIKTIICLTLCIACFACSDDRRRRRRPTPKPLVCTVANKLAPFSRSDFRCLVLGRTKEEVLKNVGKPKQTAGINSNQWVYMYKTIDPITGNIDSYVDVFFDGRRVNTIYY